MKHLYVPLDVASTFISHLQPARNADRTIRGGESVHAVEEQERVASGVTGDAGDVASALAFAAAGLGSRVRRFVGDIGICDGCAKACEL